MAVPKRKVSKARRDKRRANWKLTLPGMVKCLVIPTNEELMIAKDTARLAK